MPRPPNQRSQRVDVTLTLDLLDAIAPLIEDPLRPGRTKYGAFRKFVEDALWEKVFSFSRELHEKPKPKGK